MLEARDISFAYGKNQVLDNVSLTVDHGERVAIQAPSGFGKSTLCKILAGYLKPASGEALVDGSPLPKRGACPVQLIMQHPELAVDGKLRLKNTLQEAGPLDERLMDAFGIRQEWLPRYPHELSGGELQRFCIVRALMANPRYLIADEISTMLDAVTQAQIWHELIDVTESRGIGMLLVSHSPALTERVATRVVNLV